MPLVLAYLCPRTDVFFRSKENYITHLKKLARESLLKKRVRREIVPLAESFAELRLSASGEDDIQAWFYTNQLEIKRLALLNSPERYDAVKVEALRADIKPIARCIIDMNSSGKQVQVESKVMRPIGEFTGDLIIGAIRLEFDKSSAFLIMAVDILKMLPGVMATRTTKGLGLHLYAEDWSFIAQKALYGYRDVMGDESDLDGDSDSLYSLARVIERRYPSLTFEKYKTMCRSGLVGENGIFGESSFVHWLQHADEAPANLPELTMDADPAQVG